jgi:uncharacterized protein with PIN domain
MEFQMKRFIADSMLGRLAKWLRVMGYDTHYQPFYREGMIAELVHDGRLLLSRNRPTINRYPDSLLILSDKVQGQLEEIKTRGLLILDSTGWFSRCLTCNTLLQEASLEDAREKIPEYTLYQNVTTGLRFCASCGRFYWPGSHRKSMTAKLEEWGF